MSFAFRRRKFCATKDRWDWLEESSNPFATVVMAHLKTMETAKDPGGCYRWKLSLIKKLYKKGYDKRGAILLFEFIDWIMSLSANLEGKLWDEINEMEKEMKMEYISSVQRIGRREGRLEGLQEGRQEEALILLGRQISIEFKVGLTDSLPIFAGLTTEQIEDLAEFFVEAESLEGLRRKADELRQGR